MADAGGVGFRLGPQVGAGLGGSDDIGADSVEHGNALTLGLRPDAAGVGDRFGAEVGAG